MASWHRLKASDPYFRGWSEYRKATRGAYRGMKWFGAFMASAIVLLAVNEKVQLMPTAVAGVVCAVLSLVGTAILRFASATSQETLELPCPRCGQPFLRGPSG